MSTFAITLAARVPQSSGPPLLAEVDRLVAKTIRYTEELNRPGSATLGCPIRSMSSAVKARLNNLAEFPSEAWIYSDDQLVWAGEVQTLGIQDQAVMLNCAGLLGYTFRMGITSDLNYPATDQFLIAKGLIDSWQSQPYGHYGLDTTSIGTSGVVRDREYVASELHNIGMRLHELGRVINGFDIHVDPATRAVVLHYPTRGVDLSASIILDRLNIDSASIAASVAPEDLVSDVTATGTGSGPDNEQFTIISNRSDEDLRESYGRSWGSQNFDGVSVQGTLDGSADAYLGARSGQFFQPGLTIIPRIGAEPGDFHAGDILGYAFDAGLGMQTGNFRVGKINVTVGEDGKERMGLEFA